MPKRKPGPAGMRARADAAAVPPPRAPTPPPAAVAAPYPLPTRDADPGGVSPRRRKGLPRRAAAKDDSRSGVVLNILPLPDAACWCGIRSVVGQDASALLHTHMRRRAPRRADLAASQASSAGSIDGSVSDSESVSSGASYGRSTASRASALPTPPLNGHAEPPGTPAHNHHDASSDADKRSPRHLRTDSKMDLGQLTPPNSSPTSPSVDLPLLLRLPARNARAARR
ncbi:hypothetical protein DFJ74DRAFT_649430 [Hyaloraphidium curvatum]|nr:hypothetical protein DFJ74DRAFT_649430 [Hyaloraphidium curvatum]